MPGHRIVYCHCAYAKVISDRVKHEVLRELAASGEEFDAVSDLCEMSARRDPALKRLAAGSDDLKIAACFPRAVKWLFSAADAPLGERVEIRNMRTEEPNETLAALLPAEAAAEADSGAANGGGS